MVYTLHTVDVKAYIESGILESYVLGFASEQEVQEVRCLSHIYPEIAEELKEGNLRDRQKKAEQENNDLDVLFAPKRKW